MNLQKVRKRYLTVILYRYYNSFDRFCQNITSINTYLDYSTYPNTLRTALNLNNIIQMSSKIQCPYFFSL